MAKTTIVSFNGGEVDDYILPRVDLPGAATRAERLENIFILSTGAMELAPGTLHLGSTPSNAQVELRPWSFSIDASFCLEFSANKLRFVYGTGFQSLVGAAATVGTFSDQSTTPPAGGGSPPDGGTDPILPGDYWDGGVWVIGEGDIP